MLTELAEYMIIGIGAGSLYALGALGFVIINKASNVFNFAMGEMMMIGAYFFYAGSVQFGLPLYAAAALALVAGGLLALLLERVLLRPLLGQPPVVLVMVTFGTASMLRGVAGLVWGPDIVQLPDLLPRRPVFLGDVLIPGKLAWGTAFMLVVGVLFILYYRYSRAGIAIRATASDQMTAEGLGIDIRRVFAFSWGVAGVLATAAGIVAGSINGLTPQLGTVALEVLAVVMLAGLTSVTGVLAAGVLVGLLETFIGVYGGNAWQQFVPYLLVLAVMMVRPTGLFGGRLVERI